MIYNSRDGFGKTPYGAVAAGTPVTFRLTPPRELAWGRVFFHMHHEFADKREVIRVPRVGLHGDCDLYELVLDTAPLLGPVWYYFSYERAGIPAGFIGPKAGELGGEGVLSKAEPPVFQLTVYEKDDTPDWFGRGVSYQIFPDRFNRLKIPSPKGMVGNRTVHKNWEDTPDFLPDKNGEVKNRDFFGGSLAGIREKLPYLQDLGVNTVYLSPVFEAASNHRYDTANYKKIDPMLGTEDEFAELCREAKNYSISLILDGVFNHTGYDSVYFNGRGTYPNNGAYQSKTSEYYEWYDFQKWPDSYSSWWGVYTLPQVNESHPSYLRYIVTGQDSVVRHWLRLGASGWRLDVADELPDSFIEQLKTAAREEREDAIVIGEVWEDASNKIAYSARRRYLLGRELDGVMNYPFRDAAIGFVLGKPCGEFIARMEQLRENYPRSTFYSLMNFLGTHDTPRILTVLGAGAGAWKASKAVKSRTYLTPPERALALRRLRVAAAILYSFPGSPMVYYGDEAGVEGFEDPFNRRTYPWGHEDRALIEWFATLGRARASLETLRSGEIEYLQTPPNLLGYIRRSEDSETVCLFNNSDEPIPHERPGHTDVLTDTPYTGVVPPMSALYLEVVPTAPAVC
jgi:glycosidase